MHHEDDGFSSSDTLVREAKYSARLASAWDRPAIGLKPRRRGRPPIKTKGALAAVGLRAWVYVAVANDGAVKVGMTTDPHARQRQIGAEMRMVIEVRPEVARTVETDALRLLGHSQDDGEWTGRNIGQAMAAVWIARAEAARAMWVDPGMSEDDARLLRIGLASR